MSRCYRDAYYGGGYAETFGIRALRVLVLIGPDCGPDPNSRAARIAALADALETSIVRAAPLDAFLAEDPARLLSAPLWRRPGQDAPCALF